MSLQGLTTVQKVRLRAEQGEKFVQADFEDNAARPTIKALWEKYARAKQDDGSTNSDQLADSFLRQAYANSLLDISETGVMVMPADHATIKAVLDETAMSSLREVAKVNTSRADLKECKATGRLLGVLQALQLVLRKEEKDADVNKFDELVRQLSGSTTGGGLQPKKVVSVASRATDLDLASLEADLLPTQEQANQLKAQIEKGVAFPFAEFKQKPWYPKRVDWLTKVGLSEVELSDQLKASAAEQGFDVKNSERQMLAQLSAKSKTTDLPATQYLFLLKKYLVAFVMATEDSALDKQLGLLLLAYPMMLLDSMNLFGSKTVMAYDVDARQRWAEKSREVGFDLFKQIRSYRDKDFDRYIMVKRQREHDEDRKKAEEAKRRKTDTPRPGGPGGGKDKKGKKKGAGKYDASNPKGGQKSNADQWADAWKEWENERPSNSADQGAAASAAGGNDAKNTTKPGAATSSHTKKG
eukprot:g19651.t1